MAISSLKQLHLDESALKELYADILAIPALRGRLWNITSAEVIEDIWRKIVAKVNSRDPFYDIKFSQNEKIIAMYPFLERMVNEAADPLKTAVKLSILGNAMDLMVADPTISVENSIAEKAELPFPDKKYVGFLKQLHSARHLLIFGDNAGEIVFDRLLIETIKTLYEPEIAYVVRSVPTLNDVTLKEAIKVGIDQVAAVIENGINGPLPGTILNRCSKEVNDLVRQADLIISKGGGNFDTLDEERKHLDKKISFLLLSKCEPYYNHFGVKLYHPILENTY
jgi:uncharacterized protein with ATP-grasp and redox domains